VPQLDAFDSAGHGAPPGWNGEEPFLTRVPGIRYSEDPTDPTTGTK
jgi:hypothetical protein